MIPYSDYCDYEAAKVKPLCCGCKLPLDLEEKLKRGLTAKMADQMPACEACFDMFAAICRNPYWLMAEISERNAEHERKAQIKRLKVGGDYFA